VGRNKNNEIIIEAAPNLGNRKKSSASSEPDKKEKGKAKELSQETDGRKELPKANLLIGDGNKEEESKIKAVLATNYVLEGFSTVSLEVVEKE